MKMTSATIMLNQEKIAEKLLFIIEGNFIPQRKKDQMGMVSPLRPDHARTCTIEYIMTSKAQ
jgi:hypothetical protein